MKKQTVKKIRGQFERQLKQKLQNTLVDGSEAVSQGYARYLDAHPSGADASAKVKEILRLNWNCRILRRSMDEPLRRLDLPEGKTQNLPKAGALAHRLMRCEVVSFDVFDTLLFRAVEKPYDVFRLLEAENGIMGFAHMRRMAEQKARMHRAEPDIWDIYKILAQETGIGMEHAVEQELQMEQRVCYANPYMRSVFERLIRNGKTVAAVSDMYFPAEFMRRLLLACGYESIQEIFVSCDYQKTKSSGQLQKAVQARFGTGRSYIHVGDHPAADITASRSIGWDAFYYPNITRQGMPYRRSSMRSLAASFYKGLVNGRLHAGLEAENGYFEFGYAYGGILAVGYCQYLNRLARQEGFDQLLFTARDGYLLHKLYTDMFPAADCVYLPFSRFSAYQITMEANWRNFLRQILLPLTKLSPKETTAQALKICGLEYLKAYFGQYGLRADMKFAGAQYQAVERIFEEHIDQIKLQYKEQEAAAKQYFTGIIGEHKKICVVDVGWQGTSMMCIRYFLERKCAMHVEVSGALMGTADNEMALIRVGSGQLHSYLFSAQNNQDLLRRHTGTHTDLMLRNLLMEILFTEDGPTFLRYRMNPDGTAGFVYGPKENNSAVIAAVQKGICAFAKDYAAFQARFGKCMEVSGREAYLPLDALAQDRAYCLKLLGDYEINEMSGMFGAGRVRRLRDIVQK